MSNSNNNEEYEEVGPDLVELLQELSKFIEKNKQFLQFWIDKSERSGRRELYTKALLIGVIFASLTWLTYIDKIPGEAITGIIGFVVGYFLRPR